MRIVKGTGAQGAGRLKALGFLALLLVGCRAAPSQGTVEAVIREHFEQRHYRVVDIELGGVSEIPLGEKTYMGARGYVARVSRITLEAAGPAHKAGERLTFHNATVRITEDAGSRGGWIVTMVTGIPVP
jgi:hypothetical protein